MIVAGVDISRKYTLPEVMEMYKSGRYRGIVLQGYVVRAGDDGLIGFVPWHESTLARMEAGKAVSVELDPESMREEVEREHPIVRRTPQQRKEAVANRIAAHASVFSDEVMSEIKAEGWRRGQPITGTDIEAVAAAALTRAESDNREADAHRITRQHMTA